MGKISLITTRGEGWIDQERFSQVVFSPVVQSVVVTSHATSPEKTSHEKEIQSCGREDISQLVVIVSSPKQIHQKKRKTNKIRRMLCIIKTR